MKYLIFLQILLFLHTAVETSSEQFPKILWSYQIPQKIPDSISTLIIQNHKNYAKGFEIRQINHTTVQSYLDSIPYYKKEIDNDISQSSPDYIRFLLLSFYGGVWIDQSTVLTQDLSWLQSKNLNENSDVGNKHIGSPDIFMFASSKFVEKKIYQEKILDQPLSYLSYDYEMQFIAAKPNSTLIIQLIQQIRTRTTKTKQQKYNNKTLNVSKTINNLTNSLNYSQIFQTIIKRKQQQLDKSTQQNIKIKQAEEYYKIWNIESQKNLIYQQSIQKIDILTKYYLEFLEKVNNYTFKYYLMLTANDRQTLKIYLQKIDRGNSLNQTLQKLKKLDINLMERYFCPQIYNIYNRSFFHHFLINDNNANRFNQQFKYDKYSPFILPCGQLRMFVQLLQNDRNILLSSQENRNQIDDKIAMLENKIKSEDALLLDYAQDQVNYNKQINYLADKKIKAIKQEEKQLKQNQWLKQINQMQRKKNFKVTLNILIGSIVVLSITLIFLLIKFCQIRQSFKNVDGSRLQKKKEQDNFISATNMIREIKETQN